MKIAFFETKDWEKEYISSKLNNNELLFFSEPLTAENTSIIKDVDIISPFIYSKIDSDVINSDPNVKFIATRSTGFDHIDVKIANEKGVAVSNVPFYGENTVAEHTFALILTLSRKIFQSVEKVKRGDFSLDGLVGFDLKGKTIGIIGLGHIGQHVARMAHGFEMNILAYDLKQDKKLAKQFGIKYGTIEEVLKNSDIITLHCPYNESTKHLINLDNISSIKRGAYLINTARGGLIDTTALVKALNAGILAGAGLDVMEEECFIKEEAELLGANLPKSCDVQTMLENHSLLLKENVVITPHNAFNSKEALERILDTTIENINAFINKKPINLVKQ
jgi:D-lactate dehydrogenase